MDDPSTDHPSNHLLRAFGLGQLEAAEAEKVAEHLDGCRDCSETMAGLQDDTFVSLVRKSPEALAGQQAEVQATIDSHSGVLGESAALAELPPELLLHPRYEIVKLIGRGGMGDVYKAQHKLMNRTVALKVIRPELVRNAAAVDRFQREVQAAARLHHGNIVTAHDAERAGDSHFLVMEFVDGTDLSQVVQERGPLPVAEACDYIRQAATGLEHARQLGMVHRDIKPHNLMLTVGQASSLPTEARGKRDNYPTTKILDFGLANFASEVVADPPLDDAASDSRETPRSHQQLTQLGTMMGTPDYIAPEQAADARTADIRADIYSLGCTLHFLLTGKPPFEADNVLMKLKAHTEQSPPSLTALRKDAPAELAKVVARMMAKNPAERFQTPAAVAEALAPFTKPAASPPKRRVRTLVAALLFALLAGVIVVQTDKGRIEIRSEVDDVKVSIEQGGQEIDVIDVQTGSQIKWLPSGKYEVVLKGDRNDIDIFDGGFVLSRWGKRVVTLKRKPDINLSAKAEWTGWPKDAPPPAIAPFDADQAKQHQEAWAKHLGLPLEYTNSIGMKFRLIPPGEFRMGSTSVEMEAALATKVDEIWKEHVHSEGPQHHVILTQPLYLGVYEVTQAEYEQLMGKNPSFFATTGAGKVAVAGLDTTRHAVEMVNWTDASEFCTKLSEKEQLQPFKFELRAAETVMTAGTGYRLPTEAEWEFACRAGTTTRFWVGDQDKSLFLACWFNMNSDDRTQTVGKLRGNPFGLYDIHGNVWEWVRDWWEPTYFGQFQDKPAVDPSGPSSAGSRRVIRGGEWNSDASRCRASLRHAFDPSKRHVGIGFRVSLPIEAVRKKSPAPDLPAGAMSETVTTGFNGGFEVTKSGLPVIWFFYTPRTVPVGDFDIVMDTTDFKEGEQSLKFVVRKCESTGGRLSPGFFNEFHVENHNPPGPFETKPGETYKISFWAKNAGSEFVFKARGVSALEGDKGVVIRSKETFNEWRRFECTYTIPPKMWLRLELNVVQPGTFWIDDVQIVRVNDKAPAKPNGPNDDPKKAEATAVAREWLKLVDAGKFGECWEGCAAFAKSQITKEQVAEAYDGIRKPLGNFKDRTLLSANSFPQLPGTPPGESIVVQFETTFSIGGKQLEQITLYWDQDNQWRVAGYHVTPAPSEPDSAIEQKKQAALTAAQEWLKLIDAGKYGEAWDTSAKLCKDGIKRDAMDLAYQGLFQPLGPIKSRELRTNEYKTQLPRAPVGEYAVIQFSTQFTNGGVTETVVLTRDDDGQWRVSGYFHAPGTITPNSTSGSAVGGNKTPMR